jgi:hypothetical protein
MASQGTAVAAEEPQGSFMGDLLGMFNFYIDPQAAAKLITHKMFWIGPLVLVSAVVLAVSLLSLPIAQHVMETAPPPGNVTPDQWRAQLPMVEKIQSITVYLVPIFVIVGSLLMAGILMGSCAVGQVKAKFGWLFNMVAGLGLISVLEYVARFAILKMKSEIDSIAELTPPLGLDIFLPESTSKYVAAFVGMFSVFEIWYIVMLVLVFAAAFKVSKGKALAVVSPVIVISLALKFFQLAAGR